MASRKQQKDNIVITPVQVRMGRAALGWGVRDLAAAAKLGTFTVSRFERGEDLKPETIEAMRRALEVGGVSFIPDGVKIGS